MLSRSCLAVLLLVSSAAAAGFSYPLFDGKTLSGWTAENGCKAEVDDGEIHLLEGNGWLRSDHQYGDFLMHVEWRAEKASKYDAGIYIRTRVGGAPFPREGYQLNLAEGRSFSFFRLKGATPPPGLIKQGMAPGAGMAFLLSGGVSCIPAAIAVWALVRPLVFSAYLGFSFIGACLLGMFYGFLA